MSARPSSRSRRWTRRSRGFTTWTGGSARTARTARSPRVGTGELAFEDASPDVRAVFTLADVLRDATDGYFDAAAHRPDRRRDPTGVTKGWAVDEALSRSSGWRAPATSRSTAGGDLVADGRAGARAGRGGSASATPGCRIAWPPSWASPAWRSRRPGCTSAAGTSGTRTPARCPTALRSMTVVGPSLAVADGFATAAFAMGERGVAWVARQPGFGALGDHGRRPRRVVATRRRPARGRRPSRGGRLEPLSRRSQAQCADLTHPIHEPRHPGRPPDDPAVHPRPTPPARSSRLRRSRTR